MNKIVIYGDSDLGKRMYQYMRLENAANVLCFTTAQAFMSKKEFCGLPVIAAEELAKHYDIDSFSILIAVGYSKINTIRRRIYQECKDAGFRIASFISKSAQIDTEDVGEGCIILPHCYVGPGCKLGICNIMSGGVMITHDCTIGNFNYISAASVLGGHSHITDNCFIGLNSTIKDGITIAPYSLLGSAANVVKSTEEYGIYVGNPARMLPERSSLNAKI
ncbi:MAG: hypothetical protein IJB64_00760 [Akkermansia sp.]|nr:hypothetical protein [Akkermansia sp.]